MCDLHNFCFLYSPVGHVFLPTTAPEALLLVLSTYCTGFSLLLPKKVNVLLPIMVVILLRLPMIQLPKSQSLRLTELDLLPFHLVPTYSSFQKSLVARNIANTAAQNIRQVFKDS